MDGHALAVMEAAESWNWPLTYRIRDQGSKFKTITPKLLSCFIAESQALGGTLVDQFWTVVGKCHPRLEENTHKIFLPLHSSTVLFEGVDRETINFSPIFQMGAELFAHLCVACRIPTNSCGWLPQKGSGLGSKLFWKLWYVVKANDTSTKMFNILIQIFKRDGQSCPLTGVPFDPEDGVKPHLAHIIPNSVHNKPDTIECIAMFAGAAVRDIVLEQLNGLGNLIHIESNAHAAYGDIRWGIEARNENGKVKYIYRRVPYLTAKGPGFICHCDGDQIAFGGGPEAARLGSGPNPLLCNLQLAVARVLRMSGAADIIAQIIDDGDDSDFPHVYIASPAFCSILTAQLQLAGGVFL
ncbi:uncharacterized protein EI90DRAFT_2922256 [Cantharellus anzutake]|uniref:uncharacterized protein n=1 Tax=Cantharellus anzutake TaxID=1750568 RepID=UPI0019081CBA|nr:uncharacterized protein EI90DRAFT_2922256 [Cantharellus anzutake]KAF8330340.1 hypothetical protein EI90DRAFT_2922256 [Cantharellus anzutake]